MKVINIVKITIFLISLKGLSQVDLSLIHTPVRDYVISSFYGERTHPVTGEKKSMHRGIDLTTKSGEFYIYNLLPGKVKEISYDQRSGIYIKIDHGKYESIYAHLQHIYIKKGEELQAGEIIGKMGETGRVTGKHLHFGVKKEGSYIDPLFILEIAKKEEIN